MKVKFILKQDTISPRLAKAVKAAKNPQPAMEAAGQVIVSRTIRAFDEPGVRPAPWQALKASTIAAKAKRGKSDAILKADGVLWRSIRIVSVSKASVTVGTDRFYARFHQLGTKRMPARPFFPFDESGRLTQSVTARVESAMARALKIA